MRNLIPHCRKSGIEGGNRVGRVKKFWLSRLIRVLAKTRLHKEVHRRA